MKRSVARWGIGLTLLAGLSACGTTSILEGKRIDYKSAGKLPPLEVPPDLTAPTGDDRYSVPDVNPRGSATFSVYSKERSGQTQASGTGVLLPNQDRVSIQRAGSQRWLVVQAKPEVVWPVIKEFWQDNGFLVNLELPDAGVLETDWAENRAKIPQDMIRNLLGKVLDGLYSTAERDKFRTRLERGPDGQSTEIYVSHRGLIEVLEGGGGAGTRSVWQPRPADPELEAEFLRRLMGRFGVEDARAKSLLTADGARERARITRTADGQGHLALSEPFDRAWRRVGLALDRVGFTVEDRDRAAGVYFVRYLDPEADTKKDEKGFFSRLAFWKGDSKKPAEQYRIQVKEVGGDSQVVVLGKTGPGLESSETAVRILGLLYEQLK